MTTLARDLAADDRILVVDAHDARLVIDAQVRIDDELLVFGEHAELPQDEADDEPKAWYVRRGVDGTVPAAHAAGTALYAVGDAKVTGSGLTRPSPFATPTLAEVLEAGAVVVDSQQIVGPTGEGLVFGAVPGDMILKGRSAFGENPAGTVYLIGGGDGLFSPAEFDANAATADADGRAGVWSNGTYGASGQALVSDDNDRTVWGGIASGVGAPANAAAFAGFLPLYRDTANDDLYILVGSTVVGPYNLGT